MTKIRLDLHREGDLLLLVSEDIYNYVGEIHAADVELALYINKWCKYLNYYVGGVHNDEMMFVDAEYIRLESWIDGYNFAKKYEVDYQRDKVEIRTQKHLIVLAKPFEMKEGSK